MNLLEEILKIDILQIADDLGLKPDSHHRILCPFHQEDTPSLTFYPHTNSFFCFGCSKTGNQLTLYTEITKTSVQQAMKDLAAQYLPQWQGQKWNRKPYQKPNLQPVKVKVVEKEQELNPLHVEIYEALRDYCLLQPTNPTAEQGYQYLKVRGLSDETIRKFRLFVIKDYVDANAYLKTRFPAVDLRESGLYNEKNNLVFYRHPIMIPYLRDGRIVYLQGRTLGQPPEGVNRYQFLTGHPITLFNSDQLKSVKLDTTVFVTEGAFDCMKLVQEGYPAVSLGTANVFKRDWVKLFKRVEVCFLLDNDHAGHKAADEMEVLFQQFGILTTRRNIPKGFKDPNEFLTAKLGLNEQLGLF
ncbi:MAG: CHC2 zinc finger domain-containing protein [Spirosomataceae bacterium]